jgi:primary-amine oxidase
MKLRATAAVVVLVAGLIGTAAQPAAAQAPAPTPIPGVCAPTAQIIETLPNGTTWQMCWRMNAKNGLVLEHIAVSSTRYPAPVRVIKSLTVAQLNVPYDTGATEYNDITEFGFGGPYLQTLGGEDCKGGSARVGSDGAAAPTRRKVLCVSAEASGLAYHQNNEQGTRRDSKQGHDLVLRAISRVGWYEYVTEYRLHDDGEISARLGATGDLSPYDWASADKGWPIGKAATDFAASHYHSAFWRVDFDIAARGGEKIEQYDTKVAGQGTMAAKLTTTKKVIATEGSFSKANRRWWRVVSQASTNTDNHKRSYELVTGANDVYEAHPETTPDVTFTQYRACERYATGNADPQCGNRESVLNYTADKQALKNPIMWVRVGFHHVPRDEDQSPMPLHWQGFDLVPRDFTEMNRLTPAGLTGNNGNFGDN